MNSGYRRLTAQVLCLALVMMSLVSMALAEGELKVIRCPEGGFSTLAPCDHTEWVNGVGLRLWLTEAEGNAAPSLLVTVDASGHRVTDGAAYFRDSFIPRATEHYSKNGAFQIQQYGQYTLGGRDVAATEMEYYEDEGDHICLLMAYDVREDCTIYYRARCSDAADQQMTLDALQTFAANLQMDPDYYEGGVPEQGRAPAGPAPDDNGGQELRTGVPAEKSAADDLNGFTVTPEAPIVSALADYKCAEFTARLPVGWKLVTAGLLEDYSFLCYDSQKPERCVFYIGQLGPWLKSQASAEWHRQYPSGYSIMSEMNDKAPVLSEPSIKRLIESLPAMRAHLESYYPRRPSEEVLSPRVLPDINQGRVIQTFEGPGLEALRQTLNRSAVLMSARDISIKRFECVSSSGSACEGMLGGMILEGFDPNRVVNPYGIDVWYHYGMCLMGFMAPKGEAQELGPVMLQCLDSFRFTDEYLKLAVNKGVVLAQGSDLSSSGQSLTDAWEDREQSYDIASQKYSDATLGYDRLYDSETGEIYRADLNFYDSYDRNRDSFSNPNLYLIDSGNENYYLRGVDYYIGR